MERAGYYRKYIILKELDQGFGVHLPPEGFVRLEGNKDGVTISLQTRNLREGTEPYTVILVYGKDKDIGVIRAGSLEIMGQNGFFRRKLDYEAVRAINMQPENMQYVLLAAEHQDRILLPMVGICSRPHPWNEAVRQRLIKKGQQPNRVASNAVAETIPVKKEDIPLGALQVENKIVPPVDRIDSEKADKSPRVNTDKTCENLEGRVDDGRLEEKLRDYFESIEPFSNPRQDYSWYRVNDLARLSNLLFACNMRIPLFANPRILVGLFKYRHLLAGFYRSAHNDMKYFVLGVPARDDSEGKPFENISRWVDSQNTEYGDMTGYWLVYINLRSGEFVK